MQWRVHVCTWDILRRGERYPERLQRVSVRAVLRGRRKCADALCRGVLRFNNWAHHRSLLRAVRLCHRQILCTIKHDASVDVCRVSHGGLLRGGRQCCCPMPAGDVRHESRAPKRILQRAVPAGYVQQWRWVGCRECMPLVLTRLLR